MAERRAKGLHNAMSDEGEEGGDGDGADTVSGRPGDAQVDDNRTAAQPVEDVLKAEFAAVWSQVRLSRLIAVEAERIRVSEYMYLHFSLLTSLGVRS